MTKTDIVFIIKYIAAVQYYVFCIIIYSKHCVVTTVAQTYNMTTKVTIMHKESPNDTDSSLLLQIMVLYSLVCFYVKVICKQTWP